MKIDFFSGRRLAIATKHRKEIVIEPALSILEEVEMFVPTGFDTDRYGTFSGEIERTSTPLEAARKKCLDACATYGCTLAVASEGSFGPHPYLPFVSADDEIILLLDLEHGLEIKARELTTATNFSGELVKSYEEIEAYITRVSFPSHGLILRRDQNATDNLVKGVTDRSMLDDIAGNYLSKYGQMFIETDMRAMYNPTRMEAIARAATRLAEAILRVCPHCDTPGFDITDVVNGLPCAQCGSPTKSTLSYIYTCQRCLHTEGKAYPHGKTKETPMYCGYCNP
ncbi:MAG TPA: DUF6671 family protein [Flavipsychrobacter sp.]